MSQSRIPRRHPRAGALTRQQLLLALAFIAAGLYLVWQSRVEQAPLHEPRRERPVEEKAGHAGRRPHRSHPHEASGKAGAADDGDQGLVDSHEGPARGRHPEPEAGNRHLPVEGDAASDQKFMARGVVIRDRDGREVVSGSVDLGPTIERIRAGRRLEFSHDGVVFENREQRLPQKPSRYYHEYVHPTHGIDGPGPQRIVMGKGGEMYYTADHYRTFRRWDEERGWVSAR